MFEKMNEQNRSKKPKDYRKLSRIKSAVFLILAAVILIGMYLKENPGNTDAKLPAEGQIISGTVTQKTDASGKAAEELCVQKGCSYTDKEHVALYLHQFGELPPNYITKTKAKKEGWNPEEGNLQDVLPGMSIGGGEFRNEDKLLPEKEGRSYRECDIDYQGGPRGEKRIVYSDDGLIYYTGDHYVTFELLYGEEQ